MKSVVIFRIVTAQYYCYR